MNYKVLKINSGYSVVENSTDQTIRVFQNQADARKLMKHLNLGGGFDSWTPPFFLKNISNNSQKSSQGN
jgi:hypothetical protein